MMYFREPCGFLLGPIYLYATVMFFAVFFVVYKIVFKKSRRRLHLFYAFAIALTAAFVLASNIYGPLMERAHDSSNTSDGYLRCTLFSSWYQKAE